MICKCGDPITQKSHDESLALGADYPRCGVCLSFWAEAMGFKNRRNPDMPVKPRGVKKAIVTIESVEQCAFDGLSMKEAAIEIKCAFNTLQTYIYGKRNPEIKEAWFRGKERRSNDLNHFNKF